MTHILFNRTDMLEVCRYTSVKLLQVGSLWCEAVSSDADLETFRLNNIHYRVI